jgi:hypothetical protein
MITKTLNTRIKLKYDTLENWLEIQDSFFPLKGEVCCVQIKEADVSKQELPPVMFKVGIWNGIEGDPSKISFRNLNWASALAADVHAWAKKSANEFIAWVNELIEHPIKGLAPDLTYNTENKYLKINENKNIDLTGFAKQGISAGNYLIEIVTGYEDAPVIPLSEHAPVIFDAVVDNGTYDLGEQVIQITENQWYDLHIGDLDSSCIHAQATSGSGADVLFKESGTGRTVRFYRPVDIGIDSEQSTILYVSGFSEPTRILVTSQFVGLGIEKGAQVNKINSVDSKYFQIDNYQELKLKQYSLGADTLKSNINYTGADAEVWIFDCGGAPTAD